MSSMSEPDFDEDRPELFPEALERMWIDSTFTAIPSSGPPLSRLIEAFQKTHTNGGALFASFRITASTEMKWFLSRNRIDEIDFADRCLRTSAVASSCAELVKNQSVDSFGFKWASTFTFSGELAQMLAQGGAYYKPNGGAADAFAIAEDFRRWLIGDAFEDIVVMKSYDPWSAWFEGVAWDYSALILDKRQERVSILAVTDTD